MKRAVVFDFDNTLEEWLPFEEDVEDHLSRDMAAKYGLDAAVFLQVFRDIKLAYLTKRSLPRDFGREAWFSEALAHFGIYAVDTEPIVRHYWELLISSVRLFPGTIDVLRAVRSRFLVAMLTDGDGDDRQWKERRIDALGIRKYFDVIVMSNDVGANKPHPRCFLTVADLLGVRPGECFMIGDNPLSDLSVSHDLGFTTIWQREGLPEERRKQRYPFIDYVVDHITEVPALVLAKAPQVRHQAAR